MTGKFSMKEIYKFVAVVAQSKLTLALLVVFCAASFALGQKFKDMNLFAASGGVLTVGGLLSLIRFTTLDKLLLQETMIANSSGLTGPPVSEEEAVAIEAKCRAAARTRISAELRSEIIGLSLTVIGTLIWAYGIYVPLHLFS